MESRRHSEELITRMEPDELFAPSAPMVLSLLISCVSMALGAFVAVAPHRAAEIWGSQRLQNLAPERISSFVSWYRIFGILLFVGGVLFAVDEFMSFP